jgi:MscS family membrane protein
MQTDLVPASAIVLSDLVLAIGIVVASVGVAGALYYYSRQLEGWLERTATRSRAHLFVHVIVAAQWPLPIGIVALAIYGALRFVLDLGKGYPWLADSQYLIGFLVILVAWTLANLFSQLVKAFGQQYVPESEERNGYRLTDLAGIGVRYLIWFIAILYLLSYLDISITPLLAGAGIAGIAIALAAQDILSNLFGGLIIILDRPLGVGDKVRIDPYVGTVTRIGLRSTRIRTLDGLVATVPNSRITTNIVVNYSTGRYRLFVPVPVVLGLETELADGRATLTEIAREVRAAAPEAWEMDEGTVRIAELGRFGPVFIMTFSVRDETDPLEVKDQVYGALAEAVREERLSIATTQGGPNRFRDPTESAAGSMPGASDK